MTATGLTPSTARPSNRFAYTPAPHPPPTAVNGQNDPTTPTPQPLPGITL
jgi:hypothetical protein